MNQNIIIIFLTSFLIITSCEVSFDNSECSELTQIIYFKDFKYDSFNELNCFFKFDNGEIKSFNYSHSGLENSNGDVVGVKFKVNEPVDYDNTVVVFKFDDYIIELSSVVCEIVERYTMFTVVNECEIKEYKINGIKQIGNRLELSHRYLDDYKNQKSLKNDSF